jgi:hypothetical protein
MGLPGFFKGKHHTADAKARIGRGARGRGRGGFNVKIRCPRCDQEMSPANLAKHLPACEDRDELAHLFKEPVTTTQVKSFRRNLEIYGLTASDFLNMFAAQGGVCAICRKPNHRRRRLAVDHCHASGRVRGLLCDACNNIIGMAGENPMVLRAAADYVEKNSVCRPALGQQGDVRQPQ